MNSQLRGFDFLFERCKKVGKKKVAIVCPYEDDALLAIDEARKEGFVSAVLVGDGAKIKAMADKIGVSMGDYELIEAPGEVEAAEAAVRAVSSGAADLLMKGMIKTATLLKAVLNKEWGLRPIGAENSLLSHIMFTELSRLGNRVIATTDGGMNMYPDLETKKQIIANAVECFNKLGIEKPKIAMLTGREGNIEGLVTVDEAIEMGADLWIVPDIDSGNMLGKATIYMAGSTCAGVLLGARKPVIMLSRHDTMRTKLCSIALGAALAE